VQVATKSLQMTERLRSNRRSKEGKERLWHLPNHSRGQQHVRRRKKAQSGGRYEEAGHLKQRPSDQEKNDRGEDAQKLLP